MDRPSGRLQETTCLNQVAKELKTLNAQFLPSLQRFCFGETDKGATEGRLQVTLGYTMLVKKAKKPNFVEVYLSWLPDEGRQKQSVSESDCCHPSDMNFKNYEKQSTVPRFSWTLVSGNAKASIHQHKGH